MEYSPDLGLQITEAAIVKMENVAEKGSAIAAAVEGIERQFGDTLVNTQRLAKLDLDFSAVGWNIFLS